MEVEFPIPAENGEDFVAFPVLNARFNPHQVTDAQQDNEVGTEDIDEAGLEPGHGAGKLANLAVASSTLF